MGLAGDLSRTIASKGFAASDLLDETKVKNNLVTMKTTLKGPFKPGYQDWTDFLPPNSRKYYPSDQVIELQVLVARSVECCWAKWIILAQVLCYEDWLTNWYIQSKYGPREVMSDRPLVVFLVTQLHLRTTPSALHLCETKTSLSTPDWGYMCVLFLHDHSFWVFVFTSRRRH